MAQTLLPTQAEVEHSLPRSKEILDAMILNGNSLARIRKQELDHLCSLLVQFNSDLVYQIQNSIELTPLTPDQNIQPEQDNQATLSLTGFGASFLEDEVYSSDLQELAQSLDMHDFYRDVDFEYTGI